MKISIALLFGLFSASIALACGSSDSGSAPSQCESGVAAGKSAECQSCVKASCKSQTATLCAASCGNGVSSSDCQNAAVALVDCIDSSCESQCNSDGQGGGTGSGGSDSVGGSSSLAGSTNAAGNSNASGGSVGGAAPECVKLETCCVALTAGPKEGCEGLVKDNYGPSCTSTYALYKCDSVLANAGKPKSAACTLGTQCIRTTYTDSSAGVCMSGGGVASENCPALDVIGCCTLGPAEVCSYTGDDSPMTAAECEAEGGTFSTAP